MRMRDIPLVLGPLPQDDSFLDTNSTTSQGPSYSNKQGWPFRSHSSSPTTIVIEGPSLSSSVSGITSSTPVSSWSISSSDSTGTPTAVSNISRKSRTAAITGGVVGGIVLLLALLGLLFRWRRHRRRTHVAPSAEFMSYAVSSLPDTKIAPAHIPLARQTSLEDDHPPPAFTSGSFKDPVFEKVRVAAEQRREFREEDEIPAVGRYDRKAEQSFLIE